jgi:hypothetical protein
MIIRSAVACLFLAGVGSTGLAQQNATRVSASLGFAFVAERPASYSPKTGLDAKLAIERSLSTRFGWRAGMDAAWFTSAVFVSPCPPENMVPGCSHQRDLSVLAGVTAELTMRPLASWLELSAGPGLHWAGSDNWSEDGNGSRSVTAPSAHAGIAIAPRRSKLGVGVRMSHFPSGLGELRSIVSPTLSLRF